MSGVFLLTLPLPIVVQSFSGFYKNRLWRNEVILRKKLGKFEKIEKKTGEKNSGETRSI